MSGFSGVSSPVHSAPGKFTFLYNGATFAGSISTAGQWMFNSSDIAAATGSLATISKSATAATQLSLNGVAKTNVPLHIVGTDASQSFMVVDNYGNSSGPSMVFRSGRGTAAAPTATQSGDFLFNFYGQGYGATAAAAFGAFFGATALETWTDSAQGSAWEYWTNSIGAASLTRRVRIAQGLMVGGTTDPGAGAILTTSSIKSIGATSGVGYSTGAGGAITQASSRTTGVTIDKVCGEITLVSAAGSASFQSFTVTNSAIAAADTIIVNQKSGTDLYEIHVTAVAAGSFRITFRTTGGTTTEQPVFNFSVLKAVAA
jgi:hypothetical protein